jgi:Uma2 family endonuclease
MSTALKRLSVAEYLAFERPSTVKHEFFDGEIFAMAAANESHNLITGNLVGELGNQLRVGPCRVYASDMRVVLATGLRTYPDVVVVREKPQFEDDCHDTLLNPLVIFEVLSPTTELYDQTRKFAHYRTCPSLREYVLVSQDQSLVEHFARQPETGQWLLTARESLDAELELPALKIRISLREVFAKVEFPAEEPPPPPPDTSRRPD